MVIFNFSAEDARLVISALEGKIKELENRYDRHGRYEKDYDDLIKDYKRLLEKMKEVRDGL